MFYDFVFVMLKEVHYTGDVEGPLHPECEMMEMGDNDEYDLAVTKNNAIVLPQASTVMHGFSSTEEEKFFTTQKSNYIKDVQNGKLKIQERASMHVPDLSNIRTTDNSSPMGSSAITSVAIGSTTTSTAISAPLLEEGALSNLDFYSISTNAAAVVRTIRAAGCAEAGAQYRLDAMQTAWDLTRDPSLLVFLTERGILEMAINTLCELSKDITEGSVATASAELNFSVDGFEVSDSLDNDAIRKLALLIISNMTQQSSTMRYIQSCGQEVIQSLQSICQYYASFSEGMGCAFASDSCSALVLEAITPENIAAHSKLLREQLLLQRCTTPTAGKGGSVSPRSLSRDLPRHADLMLPASSRLRSSSSSVRISING